MARMRRVAWRTCEPERPPTRIRSGDVSCDDRRVPRVALLSDLRRAFDPHADPRNVAMIRRRHDFWMELSRLHGWDLAVCDAAEVEAPGRAASVCWIDLPMLTRSAYRAVFSRATATDAGCVLQHPDEVEQVLGLDRSYPVLVRAGIPTPRTAFVPVDDALADAIDSPAAVRRLLTEQIYGALFDEGLDPHDGIFVRGFYSSAKSANPEHYFGNNQADIEATVHEVLRRLRVGLEVGGLALRQHLALDRIELAEAPGDRDAIRVSFEVRLTVLQGRVLCASFHGPFDVFAEGPRRALTEALAARHAAAGEAIRALLPRLLAADLPPSYVADVAFTREGDPVVLELNPLYAVGYNVPPAHALIVAALGADLACRAGYPELSWTEILETAASLAGEPVEQSPAVWLFR